VLVGVVVGCCVLTAVAAVVARATLLFDKQRTTHVRTTPLGSTGASLIGSAVYMFVTAKDSSTRMFGHLAFSFFSAAVVLLFIILVILVGCFLVLRRLYIACRFFFFLFFSCPFCNTACFQRRIISTSCRSLLLLLLLFVPSPRLESDANHCDARRRRYCRHEGLDMTVATTTNLLPGTT
jgi:hypothetical protein